MTSNRLVLVAFLLALGGSTSSLASESVRCVETLGADPATVTVQVKYSPGIPIPMLEATIKSPTHHLNYSTLVKRAQKRGKLSYFDPFIDKAFLLTIQLTPGTSEGLSGTFLMDEGKVTENKVPNLSCTVSDIPPPPSAYCMEWTQAKKDAALIAAAQTGTMDQMDAILDCGANPNFRDAKGCTPLLYVTDLACGYRPSSNPKPHPNPANPHGDVAPIQSSRDVFNLEGLINLLLSNGAQIEAKDPVNQETALLKLVKYGQISALDIFIELEANINARDSEGNTALMLAAGSGNDILVRTVLQGNPDLTLKNKEGKTAYEIAKDLKYEHLFDLLAPVTAGETIEGKEDGSCTPTMVHLMAGKPVQIVLKSNTKMFLLEAPGLNLELMSMPGQPAKQTITPLRTGTFPFTCGVHGAPEQIQGSFMVM